MKPQKTWPMMLLAAAVLVAAVTAVAAPAPEVVTESTTAIASDDERSCCVANPRFAGICKVSLGPEETCRDVLDYLNNVQSKGRTYCGNTDVRMGWKQVQCQEEGAAALGACQP